MAEDFSGDRIADMYAASRQRLLDLLEQATFVDLVRASPATPGWRVRDVVAHLVANLVDGAAGRLNGGPPSPSDTARQVAERHDKEFDEVLAEWDLYVEPMLQAARDGLVGAPVAIDMITHEQDIRRGLNAPKLSLVMPEQREAIRLVAAAFGGSISQRAVAKGMPPIAITAADSGWSTAPTAESDWVTAIAPNEFEIGRALSGRRSGDQVASWQWSGDATPYLTLLCPFGRLREDDLVE